MWDPMWMHMKTEKKPIWYMSYSMVFDQKRSTSDVSGLFFESGPCNALWDMTDIYWYCSHSVTDYGFGKHGIKTKAL